MKNLKLGVVLSILIMTSPIYCIDNSVESNNVQSKQIEKKLSNSLFEKEDKALDTKPNSNSEIKQDKDTKNDVVSRDKKLKEFIQDIESYQKEVEKEWIVLIIMGIAGIGGLILVFINLFKIKKMQDEIEDKQKILMKDIEESEKYV